MKELKTEMISVKNAVGSKDIENVVQGTLKSVKNVGTTTSVKSTANVGKISNTQVVQKNVGGNLSTETVSKNGGKVIAAQSGVVTNATVASTSTDSFNRVQKLYGPPVTGNLSMTNATYARSSSGATKLKNDFYGDIDNLIKILNGDKYAAFKKVVSANWTGADATDFLNDVEKTRKALETKLKALKSKFSSAIDADQKQFTNFQNKNVK